MSTPIRTLILTATVRPGSTITTSPGLIVPPRIQAGVMLLILTATMWLQTILAELLLCRWP